MGSSPVAITPVKLEVSEAIQDVVITTPDTPPISPAVSLNPSRIIHPGIKQSTLPGGAGSDFLLPTSHETPQQIPGEKEASKTSGELEISKDMIPETPKPTIDTDQFIPPNASEPPEPAPQGLSDPGSARGSETIGQLIRPVTPLPAQIDTPESQGQVAESQSSSQSHFKEPATATPGGPPEPVAPPATPAPEAKSVQFKSRVWPGNPAAPAQPAAPEQFHPEPAGTPNLIRPLTHAPGPGQAPNLIRPAGFPASSQRPAESSTPTQYDPSTPTQSGPPPIKPANIPALRPTVSPPAPPISQPGFAPGHPVAQPAAHNRQQQQQNESDPGAFPWQRSVVENRLPIQAPVDDFELAEPGLGRFDGTSKAAEHWRQSWRDRQRAEAGPAENVSRGHAAVPMPLMAMQQSLARMRAIIIANKEQDGQSRNLGFWITVLLMVCLIGGLGAYIISSYIPSSPFVAARIEAPAGSTQPSLVLQGAQPAAIVMGQSLHLHGEHFGANDPITFLLDTTQAIVDASERNISVQANDQGTFDATIPVGNNWTAGTHVIQALDNHTNQFAYLTIEVSPAGTPVKTSADLALTLNGQPLRQLSFKAVLGQDNPSQRFTLANTSGAPLKWSAEAIANNNLTWLVINDNHTSGTLDIAGTDSIGVSAITTGLNSQQPYTGQILFTINGHEQLTLPVQLVVQDAPAELIFSPDPIVAHSIAGGTCQSGASLTLINLGEQGISWKLGMDGNTSSHLHFSSVQGSLAPSELSSSTQVLTLTCTGVQVGDSYTITLYANNAQWTEQIFIQT